MDVRSVEAVPRLQRGWAGSSSLSDMRAYRGSRSVPRDAARVGEANIYPRGANSGAREALTARPPVRT
jgi:hypothetical protein